jgi:hypothetical protein
MVEVNVENKVPKGTSMIEIDSKLLDEVMLVCEKEEITVEDFLVEAIPRYIERIKELNEKGIVRNPDGTVNILVREEAFKYLTEEAEKEGISVSTLTEQILSREGKKDLY